MEDKLTNKRIEMITAYSIASLVGFMNSEKITKDDVIKLGEFETSGQYYLIYEQ